jgi:hypothetical protein
MATRVLLTVDTELRWGPYAAGASWRENLQRSFEPAGVGVSWQLDLLARHGLSACFFVDPMPALVYGLDPVRAMVSPILAAGQEVQLHLHPCWRSVAAGNGAGEGFELTAFPAAEQRALVAQARQLLVDAEAPPPIAFRSGSFAADADTLAALAANGIRFDSSHNGSEHPWHPLVTIVSHSFEFASRDGARSNRTLCRRFERLCAFLAAERERFPTARFTELDDLPLDTRGRPLAPRRLRTARRMAEQLWSNAVYERAL